MVSRISWHALGGYNFTLLDGEIFEVTEGAAPARNSRVSATEY